MDYTILKGNMNEVSIGDKVMLLADITVHSEDDANASSLSSGTKGTIIEIDTEYGLLFRLEASTVYEQENPLLCASYYIPEQYINQLAFNKMNDSSPIVTEESIVVPDDQEKIEPSEEDSIDGLDAVDDEVTDTTIASAPSETLQPTPADMTEPPFPTTTSQNGIAPSYPNGVGA